MTHILLTALHVMMLWVALSALATMAWISAVELSHYWRSRRSESLYEPPAPVSLADWRRGCERSLRRSRGRR